MSQDSLFPARLPRTKEQISKSWKYFFPPNFTAAILLFLFSILLLGMGYLAFQKSIEPQRSWFQPAGPPPTKLKLATNFLICMVWGFVPLVVSIRMAARQNAAFAQTIDLAELDELLRRDLELIKERSLKKIEMRLGGSDSSSQMTFHEAALAKPESWLTGCVDVDPSWSRIKDAKPAMRTGTDRMTRFAINRMAILVLAEHHLAYYHCDFNLSTGLILKEEVVDCHYKDVHMINYLEKKVQSADAFDDRLFAGSSNREVDLTVRGFRISIGSSAVEIPLGIRRGGDGFETDSLVDPIVSRIRYLLREKRRSYVRLAGSPTTA